MTLLLTVIPAVCSALQAALDRGLSPRRIAPEDVVVGTRGEIVVTGMAFGPPPQQRHDHSGSTDRSENRTWVGGASATATRAAGDLFGTIVGGRPPTGRLLTEAILRARGAGPKAAFRNPEEFGGAVAALRRHQTAAKRRRVWLVCAVVIAPALWVGFSGAWEPGQPERESTLPATSHPSQRPLDARQIVRQTAYELHAKALSVTSTADAIAALDKLGPTAMPVVFTELKNLDVSEPAKQWLEQNLTVRWARKSPAVAADYFLGNAGELGLVLQTWMGDDLEAAFDWYRTHTDELADWDPRGYALSALDWDVFSALAKAGWDQALDAVDTVHWQDPTRRDNALITVVTVAIDGGKPVGDTLDTIAGQIAADAREPVLAHVVGTVWAADEPAEAARWVETHSWSEEHLRELANAIWENWSPQDPEAAEEWLRTQPGESRRGPSGEQCP